MTEQARMEYLRKQEIASQLDLFRKAQYEAENAGGTEALENIPKVEDIVPGGWNASSRKRKKNAANESAGTAGPGLKIRKMSSTPGTKLRDPGTSTENLLDKPVEVQKMPAEAPSKAADPALPQPTVPKPPGLLGLVTYSSDEDD